MTPAPAASAWKRPVGPDDLLRARGSVVFEDANGNIRKVREGDVYRASHPHVLFLAAKAVSDGQGQRGFPFGPLRVVGEEPDFRVRPEMLTTRGM